MTFLNKLFDIFFGYVGKKIPQGTHICKQCKKLECCDYEDCKGTVEVCRNCDHEDMMKRLKELDKNEV